jgi:hypothetical protein
VLTGESVIQKLLLFLHASMIESIIVWIYNINESSIN